MTDCIFCKILEGSVPADKVYEDTHVIGFLDIAPIQPGHTLIIPRKHAETIFDNSEHELGQLMIAAKKVGRAILNATGATGLNVGINTHKSAGQVVFHTHLHLIPRHENDGLRSWPHMHYKEQQMQQWAEKIRAFLR